MFVFLFWVIAIWLVLKKILNYIWKVKQMCFKLDLNKRNRITIFIVFIFMVKPGFCGFTLQRNFLMLLPFLSHALVLMDNIWHLQTPAKKIKFILTNHIGERQLKIC